MNKERIAEITSALYADDCIGPIRNDIERAITQAVNEALEEVETRIDDALIAASKKDFEVVDAFDCMDIVRALKLPEE